MKKLFTLLILLLLLPVTALTEENAPTTLYVGSTTITAGYWTSSDGGTTWTNTQQSDPPSGDSYIHYNGQGTLELHNATIHRGSNTVSAPYGSGIYALSHSGQPVSLTIKLIGENTITGFYGIFLDAEASATSYGTDASLTITSENNGSLQVSGLKYGIYVKSGTGNASLTINDASVVAKTTQTYSGYAGVYVQSSMNATNSPQLSLKVDGGSLTASGGTSGDGIWFYVGSSQATGATTSLTVSDNAIVDAKNGGISADGVSVKPNVNIGSTDSTGGIVFDGSTGTVYGNVTLQENLTIGEGETLTVPDGSSLNCNGNLTNNGTILASGGTVSGSLSGGTAVTTPTITTHPSNQTVTEGTQATFSVTASDAQTYQWQQKTAASGSDWTDINSATSASYTTAATTTDMNNYQYRCVVTASGVSVISSAAILTVEAKPTYTVTVNASEGGTATADKETAAEGDIITLTATPGSGYYFVKWEVVSGTVTIQNNQFTMPAENVEVQAVFGLSVTNITLDKSELSLYTGNTETLTAKVEPEDATNQNVTWQSSDSKVATVQNGTVTAVGAGEATITVQTQDGNYTASCTVTVTKPEEPKPPIDQPSYYNIYVEDVCDGVEVTTSKNVVREGNSISVYVEKDTANYTFDNFKVYYKRSYYGPWEVLEEGVQPGEYPINNIWTHIYIKAEGAVEKEDPTGMESIEGVKVYTKDGSLYVQTPQREQVLIISMTGVVVKNEEQVGLKQYQGLQPGIYIVRVGDRTYKVRLN